MANVIMPEAPLDAEAILVRRAIAPIDADDGLVLHGHFRQASDAAIGADRIHLAIRHDDAARRRGVHQRFLEQRAGRAGLHAFATTDAGGSADRISKIEHRPRRMATIPHADHVVDLHLATRALAQPAGDAGIEVHSDRGVGGVVQRKPGLFQRTKAVPALRKAALRHTQRLAPLPERRRRIGRGIARGHVGLQQFEDHRPRLFNALAGGLHHHAGHRLTDTGSGEGAFALDFAQARPAVAIRPVAGCIKVAEVRNARALALGDLPEAFAGRRLDFAAIEHETDRLAHGADSGKNFSRLATGFGAACPRPQIEPCRMT